MTKRSAPQNPDWIDDLMEDLAAETAPDPSPDFMARILADAQAHLPAPGGARKPAAWWQQVVSNLGGWGAVGGLVTATAAGFAIGLGALDGTAVDVVWNLGALGIEDAEQGLDAFGWAMEEG